MSSLFNLATATAAGGHTLRAGYRIQRSVRLRSNTGYLNRTLGASGSTTQWTFSAWTKRGTLGAFNALFSSCITGSTYTQSVLAFDSSDRLWYYQYSNASNYTVNVTSTAVFRDPSAWYHVVMKFDAPTSSMIVWVNNQQVINSSSFSTTYRLINSNNVHYIGNYAYQTVDPGKYDGYLTEVNFIDGQALTPSSFGETNPVTGVWRPKKYTGTYGTNGFYLNFSDNSAATATAIGKDSSGNGNNWTPTNISVTAGATYDSMLDSPTQFGDGGNGRGNYATLNPLSMYGTNAALASGSLTSTVSSTANDRGWPSTIAAPGSGKWYAEFTFTTTDSGNNGGCGIMLENGTGAPGESATTVSWRDAGTLRQNASGTSYGSALSANDIVMLAYDAALGRVWFGRNGTWFASGDPANNANPSATGITTTGRFASYHYGTAATIHANFGQRPFSYTPPTGFKALNTLNLPTPTILKGNQYFDTILWSGDGVNGRAITANVGTVDFAWVKKRNGIDDHRLANSVTGGNKHLKSNTTEAEQTGTTVIQAFGGNTFTVGSDNSVNASGGTYVGWTWQKGATQGFDIVTFTGDGSSPKNISHSLGVAPKMIIIKSRNNVSGWNSYHASLGNTQQINLQTTAAAVTSIDWWNNTSPTSSQFTIGANLNINTYTFVAYLFSEVAGFSKFGSYTGNGAADGPFVFCGFRPAFVLFKRTDSATGGEWAIYDSSRDRYNANTTELYPANSSADETAGGASMDFTSNGFKIRNSRLGINASGGTYIFAAFAEHPFKNALAR